MVNDNTSPCILIDLSTDQNQEKITIFLHRKIHSKFYGIGKHTINKSVNHISKSIFD